MNYGTNKNGSSNSSEHSVHDGMLENTEKDDDKEIHSDTTGAHVDSLFQRLSEQKEYHPIDNLRNTLRKLNRHETVRHAELGTKHGIEYRLEKSRIQMRELQRMGKELITNVKTLASERKSLMEKNIWQRTEELMQNISGDTLESNAKIKEIQQKWTELDPENSDVMQVFQFAEMYKEQIKNVFQQKDAIIKKCQSELIRVNSFYQFLVERQSHELHCVQERFNSELEIFRNTYKQHLDKLHNVLVSEHDAIANKFVNRFHMHMSKLNSMKEKMLAIDLNKTNVYFDSINKVARREQDITAQMDMCLQKLTDKVQMELRKFKIDSFMQSEITDYNTFVLRTQNDEGYILNNQQNLRITKLNDRIFKLRELFKMQKRMRSNEISSLEKRAEALHSNLTRYEEQGVHLQQKNTLLFKKIWTFHMGELKPLLRKVFEIDRLLYEQLLQLEWVSPEIDFKSLAKFKNVLNNERKSDESVASAKVNNKSNANGQTASKKKTQSANNANQKLFEKRFLRNILRTLGDRKGGLMPQKFRNLLIGYTKEANRLVEVHYILSAIQVTEIKELNMLVKVFEPYAWCPNCSVGLSKEILRLLYEHKKDPEDVFAILTKRKKLAKPIADCKNHYYITDPMFAFAALKDFAVARQKKNSNEIVQQNEEELPGTDEIKTFWQNLINIMPNKKIDVWRWLEHGLQHFLITLKQREQLDLECQQLRRQNMELKYLLQNSKTK